MLRAASMLLARFIPVDANFLIRCALCFGCLYSFAQPARPENFFHTSKRYFSSGVNIHFTSGGGAQLDLIKAAGFDYVRVDMNWESIEKTKGVYGWSAYDGLMSDLAQRGLGAIVILDYSNRIYEPDIRGDKSVTSPAGLESVRAFSRWAASAALRYKDRNIVWEIWNEPNNKNGWFPSPDPDAYFVLASASAAAIRSVDPSAIVIGPALAGVDQEFLEALFKQGLLDIFDAISLHPYRFRSTPPESFSKNLREIRAQAARFKGNGRIPVFISGEWGYSSNEGGGVSEKLQADYAARMFVSNFALGVPISIWYDWRNNGSDIRAREHNFGLMSRETGPKLAYRSLATMNSELRHSRFVRRVPVGDSRVHVYEFVNSGGHNVYAAWVVEVDAKTVKLPIRCGSAVVVSLDGSKSQQPCESSSLSLNLSGSLVFITPISN